MNIFHILVTVIGAGDKVINVIDIILIFAFYGQQDNKVKKKNKRKFKTAIKTMKKIKTR